MISQTVALVGESGSGKSTVIALLQRFYDPDSGQITLDGVEIDKLNVKWLRRQMGLVSQEPVLFNDTIRANIAYGKELGNATEAEVVEAAKLANAHNFISGLQQVGVCFVCLFELGWLWLAHKHIYIYIYTHLHARSYQNNTILTRKK